MSLFPITPRWPLARSRSGRPAASRTASRRRTVAAPQSSPGGWTVVITYFCFLIGRPLPSPSGWSTTSDSATGRPPLGHFPTGMRRPARRPVLSLRLACRGPGLVNAKGKIAGTSFESYSSKEATRSCNTALGTRTWRAGTVWLGVHGSAFAGLHGQPSRIDYSSYLSIRQDGICLRVFTSRCPASFLAYPVMARWRGDRGHNDCNVDSYFTGTMGLVPGGRPRSGIAALSVNRSSSSPSITSRPCARDQRRLLCQVMHSSCPVRATPRWLFRPISYDLSKSWPWETCFAFCHSS